MKRKRWAEATIRDYRFGRNVEWTFDIYVHGQYQTSGNLYAHRRSARRAAINFARKEGLALRWI